MLRKPPESVARARRTHLVLLTALVAHDLQRLDEVLWISREARDAVTHALDDRIVVPAAEHRRRRRADARDGTSYGRAREQWLGEEEEREVRDKERRRRRRRSSSSRCRRRRW